MKPSWDRRIDRAVELADRYAFAREALGFYSTLIRYQRDMYQHLESLENDQIGLQSLKGELPIHILRPHFSSFMSLVGKKGPPELARAADKLCKTKESNLEAMLQSYWKDKALNTKENRAMTFFPRAFLQPYAEYLADRNGGYENDSPSRPVPMCPLCNSRPQVGCLRPADNGSRRFLVCSLCQAEWGYSRLSCPACGKGTNDKSPYYAAEDYPHIRIEVCDNCKSYIKTVDLSKDRKAVPVVDELATIPLDLWAREQGYKKMEDNVLGI